MKISNLLLAGLAVFGLAACSNDDSVPTGTQEETKYDTYITVSVTNPASPLTRNTETQGDDATEAPDANGTADEKNISNLHVYLVQNGIIQHSFATAMDSDNPTTTVENEAPIGTYRLVTVANPNTEEPRKPGVLITSVLDNLNEAALIGKDKKNLIMATNVEHGVTIDNIGSEITITKANVSGDPAKGKAQVDRLAAKISVVQIPGAKLPMSKEGDTEKSPIEEIVAEGDTEPFFKGKDIDYLGYLLVNGNMKMNQYQEWDGPADKYFIVTPQGKIVDDVMTGFYSPFSDYVTIETEGDGAERKVTSITTKNPLPLNKMNSIYVTENKPPHKLNTVYTSGMAETTGVIFEVQSTATSTFYMVAGRIYKTFEEVENLGTFKGKIIKDNIGGMRALGIKVYENGRMFYSYFIKDTNSPFLGTEAQGLAHAVRRNSIYNLDFKLVRNIGDDVPGGGKVTPLDPNPDIDPSEVYIDVEVDVKPWLLNNIDVEF